MEKLYSVSKTRQGADCGSDHDLLVAKVRLKLMKVEKTSTPFRYDLNQIPYDYTVKATNRLKGLDLIECLKDYGQICDIVHTEDRNQDYPQEKEMQKGKIGV